MTSPEFPMPVERTDALPASSLLLGLASFKDESSQNPLFNLLLDQEQLEQENQPTLLPPPSPSPQEKEELPLTSFLNCPCPLPLAVVPPDSAKHPETPALDNALRDEEETDSEVSVKNSSPGFETPRVISNDSQRTSGPIEKGAPPSDEMERPALPAESRAESPKASTSALGAERREKPEAAPAAQKASSKTVPQETPIRETISVPGLREHASTTALSHARAVEMTHPSMESKKEEDFSEESLPPLPLETNQRKENGLPHVSLRGMARAQAFIVMNHTEEPKQFTGRTEQLLPAAAEAASSSPRSPSFLSPTAREVQKENAIPVEFAVQEPGDAGEAVENFEMEPARTTHSPATEKCIHREVVVMKQLKLDSMTVVIHPADGPALSLKLIQRNGGIEIQATCHAADYEALKKEWPSLQQHLAPQGVRLAPLMDPAATGLLPAPSHAGMSQDSSHPFHQFTPPRHPEVFQEENDAPRREETSNPPASPKKSTGSANRWETWA